MSPPGQTIKSRSLMETALSVSGLAFGCLLGLVICAGNASVA
jgi:hypothetical protein